MKPIVEPLAYWRRKVIFITLLLAFLFSLPAFMFYATGYRYDIFSGSPSITATGGLYIAADAVDSSIYVNETEVTNARVFRNASYIQGLEPGMHRVHVQAPGLHTWVKNLSVYRHIVTEAEAFNLPLVPQVRLVTEYRTQADEAVFFMSSTTEEMILPLASSSVPYIVSTSTATSTYRLSTEYALLFDLFEVKASTTKAAEVELTKPFSFSTTTDAEEIVQATTTVVRNNVALYQEGEEVYAEALGTGRQIPHYFCTSQVEIKSSLGDELEQALEVKEGELFFEDTLNELSNNTRECRTNIRIDRRNQEVLEFTFLPENANLVLLHLESGIYVVEIDDRAWQNMQPLYQGTGIEMMVYGGSVFVREDGLIFEVLTEIAS
ncbi:hypothetical protein A3I99_04320 [Candidatus Kaiserbacteria bacterium RIFCSPLOWO2_02_FULL_45_11b]|uniref:PEGA domain-containing protein n=1 Tax=Candidatus Kaiserbacteria bacterium RIFCSPLOWO2_12_FULL_45_26 TaxID=1798525 RepID=A0A1F6FHH1_9BACT|nr:MAG: hypothetical protein A2Z56_01220 [Candidatus Kaiserbacteria bacterium RIFCSPHIGHO2_12_45_16]OGG70132.1 MAG: hypothetical protein A2929_03535 [Candidatus Kaiserbacteria bacterium RIFCSPLOWO2_01_FULL_45_25]OGG83805.1 MAG: hypothetical protein A3I99_04320 [Candidatus Kaiserbacteria bacterium RIFCSPLOWO2_02_FULL_45_11b]OGG85303.1 MAG: hypothetical protein A3G90_04595 [Candidatus Kaiserbacteria bacterium RIFCSPLOWO2_12_FULL_45_26]